MDVLNYDYILSLSVFIYIHSNSRRLLFSCVFTLRFFVAFIYLLCMCVRVIFLWVWTYSVSVQRYLGRSTDLGRKTYSSFLGPYLPMFIICVIEVLINLLRPNDLYCNQIGTPSFGVDSRE